MERDRRKINSLLAILAFLMVFWGVAEFAFHTLRPDTISRELKMQRVFDKTNQTIWNEYLVLQKKSMELAKRLSGQVITPDGAVAEIRRSGYEHWVLLRNDIPVHWSDNLDIDLLEQLIAGRKSLHSNKRGFYILSASRSQGIGGHWLVSIGEQLFEISRPQTRFGNIYTASHGSLKRQLIIPFYIEGRPDELPADHRFRIITIDDETTIGHLALSTLDQRVRSYIHPQFDLAIRTLMVALVVVVIWLLITRAFPPIGHPLRVGLQLALVILTSIFGWYLDIYHFLFRLFVDWDYSTPVHEYNTLIRQSVISFSALIIAVIVTKKLYHGNRYFGVKWYPRTITISLFYGLIMAAGYFYLMRLVSYIAASPDFEFIRAGLLITPWTFFQLLIFALFALSLLAVNFMLAWYIQNSEKDQSEWVHSISTASLLYFFTTLSYWFDITEVYLPGALWMISISLTVYCLAWYYSVNKEWFRVSSLMRLTLIVATYLLLTATPFLFEGASTGQRTTVERLTKNLRHTIDLPTEYTRDINATFKIVTLSNEGHITVQGDFNAGEFPDSEVIRNELAELSDAGLTTGSGHHYNHAHTKFLYVDHDGQKTAILVRNYHWSVFIYSLFKLGFQLSLISMIVVALVQYIIVGRVHMFDKKNSFRHRITDTFVVGGIGFVLVLIVATDLLLERQKKERIVDQISETLKLVETGKSHNVAPVIYSENGIHVAVYGMREATDTLHPNSNVEFPLPENGSVASASVMSILGTPRSLYPQVLPYHVQSDLTSGNIVTLVKNRAGDTITGYRAIKNASGEKNVIALYASTSDRKYINPKFELLSVLVSVYLFGLTLFIVMGFRTAKRVVKPLDQLLMAVKGITSPEYKGVFPDETEDEIGQLSNSLNLLKFRFSELQSELESLQDEASWSHIVRQIAHEIRNPLTPMKLSVQHLAREIQTNGNCDAQLRDKIIHLANILIEEIDSLNRVASNYSNFTKPLLEALDPNDLNEVIRQTIELYQHDMRVSIFFEKTQDPIIVPLAKDEFRRVIINLIKNSLESIRYSGIILIRTHNTGKFAHVEIIDNGSGMDTEAKQRAFTPNFTTKSNGDGLGLAICKKIITAHKGDIRFESVHGLGTTFTISLPKA